MQYILVTGSNGMLGQYVVKSLLEAGYNILGVSIEKDTNINHKNFKYSIVNLTKCMEVEKIFEKYDISHIIHLAAIAHSTKGMDDSWSNYYRINVLCSKTIFTCASRYNIPVFFASTIDVYGFTDSEVNEEILPNPIGSYAKSKWLAEDFLKKNCESSKYFIARFAPIYTEHNKQDIQKRFYLKYPKICYRIGNGKEYEFLSIDYVLKIVLIWINQKVSTNETINIRDQNRLNTKELIEKEQGKGYGNILIKIPDGAIFCLKILIDILTRSNSMLKYKVYKVIKPIRTTTNKLNTYL
jgi:Nucleoside-diphosphate-sugar epimerases